MFNIRQLEAEDAKNYADHLIRHMCESGVGDNPIYTPVINPPKEEDVAIAKKKKWLIPIGQPDWSRCFGVFMKERIIGHLDFDGFHLPSGLHRVELSMGLEEAFRKQGLGSKLMEKSMEWVEKQNFIEYVDLGVFSHNKSAIKLYEKYGFNEVGRVEDRFRLFGEKIDDIIMTLSLKRS